MMRVPGGSSDWLLAMSDPVIASHTAIQPHSLIAGENKSGAGSKEAGRYPVNTALQRGGKNYLHLEFTILLAV
jgi:hypothetical protein